MNKETILTFLHNELANLWIQDVCLILCCRVFFPLQNRWPSSKLNYHLQDGTHKPLELELLIFHCTYLPSNTEGQLIYISFMLQFKILRSSTEYNTDSKQPAATSRPGQLIKTLNSESQGGRPAVCQETVRLPIIKRATSLSATSQVSKYLGLQRQISLHSLLSSFRLIATVY